MQRGRVCKGENQKESKIFLSSNACPQTQPLKEQCSYLLSSNQKKKLNKRPIVLTWLKIYIQFNLSYFFFSLLSSTIV
jgi:hypothetical protein